MSNCIVYVGGLAEATSDCRLHDLFGAYDAVVRVHIVRYKHSGKSAGYGLVEMGADEQALHAVRALQGASFAANCLRLYVTPHISIHS